MLAARAAFVAALVAVAFSATIAWEFNSLWLYRSGFQKYDVSRTTGLAAAELDKAARGLMDYFNSDVEFIDVTVSRDGEEFTLFNQREMDHLKDVKQLVRMDYMLLIGTGAYVGVYAGIMLSRRRRSLAGDLFSGGAVALGILLVMGVGSMVGNFQGMFVRFHEIAFTNDLWLLDPTKDYLIMLFPEPFWYDAVALMGGVVAGVSGALMGVGWWYTRRAERRDNKGSR